MSTSLFDTLPIEILYRICDNLDIQTILLSLRYVCKRFYLTANTYNRYHFNFKSIAKPYFQRICQIVPFENVTSLTLSDEDKTRGQIQLFLSLFHIEKFTRLQSLTLLHINDNHLNILSKYIITSSLRSLSISRLILNANENVALSPLSSAIGHQTLENLYLSIWVNDWKYLKWSINNRLNYLRIVNSITLEQFCIILQHSPNLHTLSLKEVEIDSKENYLLDISASFPQLASLIFEDGFIEMKKLEKCISFTPSLIYLKLIGSGSLFNSTFDGSQWGKIIQTKLSLLKKFEFFLHIRTNSNYRSRNIETLIDSFRTSFWTDCINCVINCDYIIDSHKILLYTLPVCSNHFVYHGDFKKISSSNFTMRTNQTDMDNVRKLHIQLTKDLNSLAKNKSLNHVSFKNVTSLTIENTDEWPQISLQFLSTILNLSYITKLSLSVNFVPEHMINTVTNISQLLNKTLNLRSLFLFDYWAPDTCMKRMKTICSIISSNIKHLKIRVKNIDDIKYILEHLEHLTSVTFEYAQILTINREDFIEFLNSLTRYASVWDCHYALHVWLGEKKTIL